MYNIPINPFNPYNAMKNKGMYDYLLHYHEEKAKLPSPLGLWGRGASFTVQHT